MRGEEKRMIQEPDRSFIVIKEDRPFPEFHYHPEYELTYIIEGRGRRIVGDHVDKFQETDLIFLGTNLPHEYACEAHYLTEQGEFTAKAIVIQFQHSFLGKDFFNLPENLELSRFLNLSSQGVQLFGKTKRVIVEMMFDMLSANYSQRLYLLFRIFEALAFTKEYNLLSSPGFIGPYTEASVSPINKAREYILQNFQSEIKVNDLLEITNMSNTKFCAEFKRYNDISFKKYLTKVRVGYACRLLIAGDITIAEAAYQAGFENLSNFNRQFKSLKGITPNQYRNQVVTS